MAPDGFVNIPGDGVVDGPYIVFKGSLNNLFPYVVWLEVLEDLEV